MKIQLDFNRKKVTVEDQVDLGELFDQLHYMLPDWKSWKLETKTKIVWNNPIYIERYSQPYFTWPTISRLKDDEGNYTIDGTGTIQVDTSVDGNRLSTTMNKHES